MTCFLNANDVSFNKWRPFPPPPSLIRSRHTTYALPSYHPYGAFSVHDVHPSRSPSIRTIATPPASSSHFITQPDSNDPPPLYKKEFCKKKSQTQMICLLNANDLSFKRK